MEIGSTGRGARLSTDPLRRKNAPIARGVLDYFPDAVVAVAELSRIGNEQHNPGQPMHWERGKSTDHADCVARHLIDRGTIDTDGVRHSAKVAWRALALLQVEIEEERKGHGRMAGGEVLQGEITWTMRTTDAAWPSPPADAMARLRAAHAAAFRAALEPRSAVNDATAPCSSLCNGDCDSGYNCIGLQHASAHGFYYHCGCVRGGKHPVTCARHGGHGEGHDQHDIHARDLWHDEGGPATEVDS